VAYDYDAAAQNALGTGCSGTSREEIRACAVAAASDAAAAGCAVYLTPAAAPICGTIAAEIAGPLFDALADGWDAIFGDSAEQAAHAEQVASIDAFEASVCALIETERRIVEGLAGLAEAVAWRNAAGVLAPPPGDELAPSGWQRDPYQWIADELTLRMRVPTLLGSYYGGPLSPGVAWREIVGATVEGWIGDCRGGRLDYRAQNQAAVNFGNWRDTVAGAAAMLQYYADALPDAALAVAARRIAAQAAEQAAAEQAGERGPLDDARVATGPASSSAAPIAALGVLGLLLAIARALA